MSAVLQAPGGVDREATKALVRRFVEEGINQGKLEVLDEVLAATFLDPIEGSLGPASVKQALAVYRGAVPDARWTIGEQVAEGDTVMSCFVASGTHLGPLWGIPATGRRMAVSGILISQCQAGRIAEQRLQLDLLGLLQQLGVMPELGLEEVVLVARLLRESQRWTSSNSGRRDGDGKWGPSWGD